MKQIYVSKYFDSINYNSKAFLINKKTMQWVAIPQKLSYLVDYVLNDKKDLEESSVEEKEAIERLASYMTDCGLLNSCRNSDSQQANPKKPLLVRIQITGKCNLACKYCYNESEIRQDTMSWDTFKNSIDLFFSHPYKDNGIKFLIYGGEAALEWELFKKSVEYIYKCSETAKISAHVCLISNGTLINDEMVKYIKDNNIGIGISFDGHMGYNDEMREDANGKHTTERIIGTIKKFKGYPLLYVLTTITSKNDNALFEIADYLNKLSVPAAAIRPFVTLDRASQMHELRVNPANYINGLKRIVQGIQEGSLYNIRVEEILRLLLPLLTTDQLYADTTRYRCGAGRNIFFVSAKGELKGCDELPNQKVAPIGNVNSRLFDFTSTNNAVKLITYKEKQCSKCTWMYICRGGCPGNACSENDKLDSKYNLGCAINRSMYPYLLDIISDNESKLKEYFLYHMRNVKGSEIFSEAGIEKQL